jgi:serine/threonine-protein kinase
VSRLDHRCDLWALATVAYEALTMALPIAGAYTHELFRNLCACNVVPVHTHNPSLPAALRGFFDRAFAPKPEDRFATAAALAAAFERAVDGAGAAETVALGGTVESSTLAMVSTNQASDAPTAADLLGTPSARASRTRNVRWAVAAMATCVLGLGGAGTAWYAVASSPRAMAADRPPPAAHAYEDPLPPAVEKSLVALVPAEEPQRPAEAAARPAPPARVAPGMPAAIPASHGAPATPPIAPPARTAPAMPPSPAASTIPSGTGAAILSHARVTHVVAPAPSSAPATKPSDKSDVV